MIFPIYFSETNSAYISPSLFSLIMNEAIGKVVQFYLYLHQLVKHIKPIRSSLIIANMYFFVFH